MRRELRAFAPDVVHVHEPPAGPLSWDACSYRGAPVVATFHAYSTKPLLNHVATLAGARRKFNQLAGRIAVSEAAAWTGRRWFGGTLRGDPERRRRRRRARGAEAARPTSCGWSSSAGPRSARACRSCCARSRR